MDPYKILGISKNASLDEIRRAYREKAKKHHPDAGGDAWAFQQVHDAYEQILKEREGTATGGFGSNQAEPPKNDPFADDFSSAPSRGGFSHMLSRHPLAIAVTCTALVFGFLLFQMLGDSGDGPSASQPNVESDTTPASTPTTAKTEKPSDTTQAVASDEPTAADDVTADIFADDIGPAEVEEQPVEAALVANDDQPEPEQPDGEVQLTQVGGGIPVIADEAPTDERGEAQTEIAATKKPSVPGKEVTQEIEKQVAELYGEKLKQARKSSDYVELAREMMRLASESDNPATKYVLWNRAIDLASDGGDASLFIDAIESIAMTYDVDPLKMKASAYYRAARAAVSRETQASLVQGMFALHDEAVAAERFAIAVPLLEKVALPQARKVRDADLVRDVNDRLKATKKLQRDLAVAQAAEKTLQATPDDPEANLQYGSFLCLVQGDWSRGLAHLTKSDNTALASAAKLELAGADDADSLVKIAEAWLVAGNSNEKHHLFLARAAWWFEKALADAVGLKRALVEKRLTELKGQLAGVSVPMGRDDVRVVRIQPAPRVASPNQEVAETFLYWADGASETWKRSNPDGTNVRDLLPTKATCAMAFDPTVGKMYWADYTSGKIHRANIDGTGVEDLITSGLKPPCLVVDSDGRNIYWVDETLGKIMRANLNGTQVTEILAGRHGPYGMAIDLRARKVYWTEASSKIGHITAIRRANLDGGGIENLVNIEPRTLHFVALDLLHDKMYWIENDPSAGQKNRKVQRSNLDGTGMETVLQSEGYVDWRGITLDVAAEKMYFTDLRSSTILRANLNGTELETIVSTGKPKMPAIYNRVPPNAEVKALYDLKSKPPTTTTRPPRTTRGNGSGASQAIPLEGLVVYYPLNGNAKDEGQGNRDLQLSKQRFVSGVTGQTDGALYFPFNSPISIPDSSALWKETFSISLWAQLDSQADYAGPNCWPFATGKRFNFNDGTFMLHTHQSKSNVFKSGWSAGVNFSDRTGAGITTDTPVAPDRWYHLAFTCSEREVSLYVDGRNVGNKPRAAAGFLTNDSPVVIGGNGWVGKEQTWIGAIDNYRIYNRALSATEVKALYDFESKPLQRPHGNRQSLTTNGSGSDASKPVAPSRRRHLR